MLSANQEPCKSEISPDKLSKLETPKLVMSCEPVVPFKPQLISSEDQDAAPCDPSDELQGTQEDVLMTESSNGKLVSDACNEFKRLQLESHESINQTPCAIEFKPLNDTEIDF
jgi:hypothetical protein